MTDVTLTLSQALKIAVSAYNAGRLHQAEQLCQQITAAQHDCLDALHLLALIHSRLGRGQKALESLDKVLMERPDDAQALSDRGGILYALRRLEGAVASYDHALAVQPDHVEALSNRGGILHALARYEEALVNCDQALTLEPGHAEALSNRGNALHQLKRFEEAVASYDRALIARPDYAEALSNRGNTLHELRRFEAALASYQQALALEPDYPTAYNNIGSALKELGRLDEARQSYIRALDIDPNVISVYVQLADAKTFAAGDSHLAVMEKLSAKGGLAAADRFRLDFALAKAYADLKNHRRSFQHLLSGNAGKRATISYDENSALALFDRIATTFTPEVLASKLGMGDPSRQPIFIIGMPRSGTTLIEQIIASHPLVHGAGELKIFSDVVRHVRGLDGNAIAYPEFVPALDAATLKQIGAHYVAAVRDLACGRQRVTDKMPSNFFFAGLIHLALPNAKIIHAVRDPIDTCVSCFSKLFAEQNHTYDLGELGRYYKAYQRLMEHWQRVLPAGRILHVSYEKVVADLEAEASRIIAHCGLDWDERCLAFHKTERLVKTVSATQVRRPIYRSAVGRWRAYEPFLAPLLVELRR